MKTLYLECGMGAAGDMLTAALSELLPDRRAFFDKMNSLGLPGVEVTAESAVSCGVTGTRVTVKVGGEEEESHDVHSHSHGHEHHHGHEHEHEHHHEHEHDHVHEHEHHPHHHTSPEDITRLINSLDVSERVRSDAIAVYSLIAEAESAAHGRPVTEIHFHEVGTLDAVADVVGVCLLMEQLAPEQVLASPVHVGCGHVHCAHGVLPVPAPATSHILRGVPTYGGSIEGELCTPTGAALLRHFVRGFGDMPAMAAEAVGYGIGRKEFPRMNCVRAFLGETADSEDDIIELCCNLDDMTGEDIAYAAEVLTGSGALDVFTTPIGMKKSRPGVLLTVLCRPEQQSEMTALMLRHTTTLGVRSHRCGRVTLARSLRSEMTELGEVRIKTSEGHGIVREKPEHDDLARLAAEHGLTIAEVRELIRNAGH